MKRRWFITKTGDQFVTIDRAGSPHVSNMINDCGVGRRGRAVAPRKPAAFAISSRSLSVYASPPGDVASNDQFSLDLIADIFHGGRGRVYITPITILGAILIARAIPVAAPQSPMRTLQIAAQGALVAISAGALVTYVARSLTMLSSPAWVNANPYLDAGRWLEASGLTQGVSGYFKSSIIRALTKGRVGVNAVSAEPGGPLEPFVFDTDAHFYLGKETPMFAIWRTGDDPFDWYRVNADTVKATYGSPTRIEHLPGGFVFEF